MEELIKFLDEELVYKSHEILGDTIYIHVSSSREMALCPYCGTVSNRVHSRYERRFKDLPIQGKKVEIVLENLKYFCKNPECTHKTFAETFACFPFKGKRSNRLTDEIVRVSLEVSSITASSILKRGVAKVGKSTICNLLKKRRTSD